MSNLTIEIIEIMKKIVTIAIILFFTLGVKAQDNPLLEQYLGNRYLINPAYGGSLEKTLVRANFRRQWDNFDNAPSVNSLSFHTRLFEGRSSAIYKKVGHGIGATLYNETEGPINLFGISGSYAYHLPFKKFQLSVGMNLSASSYGLNDLDLTYGLIDDPAVISADNSKFLPDADIGIYLYDTKEKFYLGFTGAQLARSVTSLTEAADSIDIHNGMGSQFIFMGGFRVINNIRFILETSMVGVFRQEYMDQNEVHLNAKASVVNYLNRYNDEVLSFTISYRTNTAFISQVELSMANLYLAYAYEYSFSKIQLFTSGSHNVVIGINIDKYRR